MDANRYQELALMTDRYKDDDKRVLLHALELAGEAGEFLNKLKKVFRDCDGVMSEAERINLLFELGDVQWGLAVLAKDLQATLSEVMDMNNSKLLTRMAKGTLQGSGDER